MKPTSNAVEIMHRRYIKGNKKRLKQIDKERKRVEKMLIQSKQSVEP